MRPPSPRQLDALRCIAESLHTRGYPPTLREIGERMGVRSTNGINEHLMYLERKGFITRAPASEMRSRSSVPTADGWRALGMEPPAPPQRSAGSGAIVEVNLGWRCTLCNAHTFDTTKPCAMCVALRKGAA